MFDFFNDHLDAVIVFEDSALDIGRNEILGFSFYSELDFQVYPLKVRKCEVPWALRRIFIINRASGRNFNFSLFES